MNNDNKISLNNLKKSFEKKIESSFKEVKEKIFLHTSPHHDDIMLGYLPYILNNESSNIHYFATMTSGFNAVANSFLLDHILNLEIFLNNQKIDQNYFDDFFIKTNLVFDYLYFLASNDNDKIKEILAKKMIYNFIELFNLNCESSFFLKELKDNIEFIKDSITNKTTENLCVIQKLKGMLREWEEEVLWGHLGFNCDNILHMRLGFYSYQKIKSEIEYNRDVVPVVDLLNKIGPDIITVAIDDIGCAPDTHYKVLDIMQQAVKSYLTQKKSKKKIKILGYKNVWSRFNPLDANIFFPVSLNALNLIESLFINSYKSQEKALFPVSNYSKDLFSDNAKKLMIEQYKFLQNYLGKDYFYKNKNRKLTAAKGFCFLKEMNPDEFINL